MAVEVITGYSVHGAETLEKYDAGKSVQVEDGHLLVRAPSGTGSVRTVAAFAPDKWHFARVVDATSGS